MKHRYRTLLDLFNHSTGKYAFKEAYETLKGDQKYTYHTLGECCRRISGILSDFGINSYDKVAILSENMPNWAVSFFACTAFGRIAVPMLPELTVNEIDNILIHSDTKAAFVSKKLFPKISDAIKKRLNIILSTDDFSILHSSKDAFTCDGITNPPLPDNTAAIIYTSGTTGAAKGVMLSHRNFCSNISEAWKTWKAHTKDVFLSVLPIAHTYELSIGMLYPFACGAKVWYLNGAPTPTVLSRAFARIKPTVMLSVPLIIEKIYKSSIVKAISESKFLTDLQRLAPALLYRILGARLRKFFGSRIKFFGIGGAKLDPEVESFLHRARFPYAIGYGVTEGAPLICSAGPGHTRVGSAGKNAWNVQVKLDNINPDTGEGEIVAKGDNIMRGYYKDIERTRAVLTSDGWFHTGDVATMDNKGRFFIKGRLGNMILGSSGENIYPEEIENVINSINGISESLVIEKEGHLVAMVRYDENALNWDFSKSDRFVEELEAKKDFILQFVNSRVRKSSQLKDVTIQREPFVKTATMKIKRFLYKS